MLKVALVGLGKLGLSHASIISSNSKVNLVAVCDSSTLILDAFKKFTSVKTYTDYTKLFDNEKLDVLFIATPTKLHYIIAETALKLGIHVFCEKPLSLNSAEGFNLQHLANENNLHVQVGYHNHFIGTFRELKKLLNVSALGKLYHFHG
jgi:predicted dehydrogenase